MNITFTANKTGTRRFASLNPVVKRIWVAALRSGKYRQGQRGLKRTYGGVPYYCCLGVLVEEAKAHGIKVKEAGYGQDSVDALGFVKYRDIDGTMGSLTGVPPVNVCAWAGIQRDGFGSQISTLVDFNDHAVKDFYQIADWIEENL